MRRVILFCLAAVLLMAADPWTSHDLVTPEALAKDMKGPLIIHVGFDVLYRAGEKSPDRPQEAFAIVSVKGLEQNQPVYRDGVRAIQQKGHIAHSALSVRTRLRT